MSELDEITARDVILQILDKMGEPVHSTKLVKLTYLVDYLHFQHHGRTLTGFQYMWDHFGPNAVGHAVIGEAQRLVKDRDATIDCYPNIFGGQTFDFEVAPNKEVKPLPAHAEMLIEDIVKQYGGLSVEKITEVSKQTEPFKTAAQYSVLIMRHSAPVSQTTDDQWEKHQSDIEEQGMLSLSDVKHRYGLR